ncbi:hypothetical protein HPP92_009951 [Vanilla planifolia]|uniref:glucan endo-1,3-beta-D-glucosidase n=1 Tax=Vanilla planifolia TaxID=51239 RepID=A0A835V1D6_VANPL|nr:hypothetical protein HPP92_009951 [Vanilla planifolia]
MLRVREKESLSSCEGLLTAVFFHPKLPVLALAPRRSSCPGFFWRGFPLRRRLVRLPQSVSRQQKAHRTQTAFANNCRWKTSNDIVDDVHFLTGSRSLAFIQAWYARGMEDIWLLLVHHSIRMLSAWGEKSITPVALLGMPPRAWPCMLTDTYEGGKSLQIELIAIDRLYADLSLLRALEPGSGLRGVDGMPVGALNNLRFTAWMRPLGSYGHIQVSIKEQQTFILTEAMSIWISGKNEYEGTVSFEDPVERYLSSSHSYANGIGVNWGIQASHPLPPSLVVEMLKDNKIQKVKLFGAEEGPLNALRNTGIQVMVGIQNDMLPSLAMDMTAAEKWVSKNVSSYVNIGVNISCVAVGNEPLLKSLNGTYLQYCFPALQNIQSALVKAGLGSQVKVTIPLNAGVYDSANGKPSGGEFRPEIKDLMLSIVKFLNDNNSPFIVNIYPFISLNSDPNFPIDYAFFEGSSSPVIDGSISYTNTFDANHDTLVWALKKNGFGNISIVVGEIGWPTDGNVNANVRYAQKFNQGLVNRVLSGQGTPMRPAPIDAYLFSLLDEDEKSILPGNFERHWGILSFDGQAKYQLKLGESELVVAKGVKYMKSRWCVLKPSASLDDPNVAPGVSFACGNADCTSLGYKTSCSDLDARGNISYAFNSYYQKNDQDDRACQFSNLGTITDQDPSTQTCRFPIMIDVSFGASWRRWSVREHGFASLSAASLPFFLLGLL